MPASNNPSLSALRQEKKNKWRKRITDALEAAKGNREVAAKSLRMTKRTLYRWLNAMNPKAAKKRAKAYAPRIKKALLTKQVNGSIKKATKMLKKKRVVNKTEQITRKALKVAKKIDAKRAEKLAAKRKRDAANARARRAAKKTAATKAAA